MQLVAINLAMQTREVALLSTPWRSRCSVDSANFLNNYSLNDLAPNSSRMLRRTVEKIVGRHRPRSVGVSSTEFQYQRRSKPYVGNQCPFAIPNCWARRFGWSGNVIPLNTIPVVKRGSVSRLENRKIDPMACEKHSQKPFKCKVVRVAADTGIAIAASRSSMDP